jgi:hypothetical protein
MISPNFKVREFSIADSTPYAIALSWSATAQVGGFINGHYFVLFLTGSHTTGRSHGD